MEGAWLMATRCIQCGEPYDADFSTAEHPDDFCGDGCEEEYIDDVTEGDDDADDLDELL
jgi:hypothetical protein